MEDMKMKKVPFKQTILDLKLISRETIGTINGVTLELAELEIAHGKTAFGCRVFRNENPIRAMHMSISTDLYYEKDGALMATNKFINKFGVSRGDWASLLPVGQMELTI